MKIFEYVEYLVDNERRKAAKEGQTNLIGVKAKNNKELSSVDSKFLKVKKERFETLMKGGIEKNKLISKKSCRLVMCHNGNYYSGDLNFSVHDYIIECAYYDDNFPRDDKLFEEFLDGHFFNVRWDRSEDYFKYFVALHILEAYPGKIFLSESYLLSVENLFKNKYFNFYRNLVKEKLDLELVPESVGAYY